MFADQANTPSEQGLLTRLNAKMLQRGERRLSSSISVSTQLSVFVTQQERGQALQSANLL